MLLVLGVFYQYLVTFLLNLVEEFLGMAPDLRRRPGADEVLNSLPVFTINLECYKTVSHVLKINLRKNRTD